MMEIANSTFMFSLIGDNSTTNETFPTVVVESDIFDLVSESDNRDTLYLVIPITLIYAVIFITGCIGNISTCIVIARNKSMYSATNYYLFSLAVSDFILLCSGVPMELYHIWFKNEFAFSEVFCVVRNMINEMAANATVLTITAFTIERYFAICHPFLSHTMSKLSRAVKYIFLIWILSISFAVPLALQTGVISDEHGNSWCTVVEERVLIHHSFELATVLFFFTPMTLITVLYILIGLKLRSSTMIKRENGSTVQRNNNLTSNIHQNTSQSTKRVLKMLVAVVICFFLCWAPFHAQRLVYMWAMNYIEDPIIHKIFVFTTYVSGVLYYVSTCINAVVYNIMSNKFRQAFKETLQKKWCTCTTQTNNQKRPYRMLSRSQRRYGQPESGEYSGSGKDEYSSSTQKQSIDTIATSRNTSLKHYKMNKSFTESAVLSASLLGIGSNATRFSDGNDTTNSNCHACLTSVVTNPEINILSDCNINEIHLNFFPPSATYIKSSTSAYPSSQVDLNPRSILNIDVHEKVRQKIIGDMESTEDKRKMSLGYFSHIALRRCDDSILNISIGNSSKITKRHKKNSWFLRRLWKFSHKRKSSTHKSSRWYFSPQLNKDDVYRLSTGSLNFLNDELIISINKRNYNDNQRRVSFEKIKHNNENQQPSEQVSRDFLVEFTKNNTDDGANELDCYMDEIKRRENGMF